MSTSTLEMSECRLPEAFRDLETHLGWCLETERERSARRQLSSIEQLREFYEALLPRMPAVLSYLQGYTMDDVPRDVHCLSLLTLSLAEIAPAVENYGQASVVDGYDVSRFNALHDDVVMKQT